MQTFRMMNLPSPTRRISLGRPSRAYVRRKGPILVRCDRSVVSKLDRHQKAKNTAFYDAVDAVSIVGTVGGAALVALGYDLMFAALPIGLPVFSLFIGIRRERLRIHVTLSVSLFLTVDFRLGMYLTISFWMISRNRRSLWIVFNPKLLQWLPKSNPC